jgi:uncharacterized protein YcbK (DUF882 family)
MIKSKYFTEGEFRNCSPSCSLQDMKQSTMNRLDTMRQLAGIPLIINSAYRPQAWEKAKRRSGTGSHTLGQAVDIRCTSETNRWRIIEAAIKVGFTRIGIAKTYIHVDDSQKHTQGVVWLY